VFEEAEAQQRGPASFGGQSWGGDVLTRSVEQHEVLGVDEQLDLWRAYKAGQEAAAALKRARSATGRNELAQAQRAGDVALERLIGANFRLVLAEVRDACDRRYGSGAKRQLRDELRADGYAAMYEAICDFDPAKASSLPGHISMKVRSAISTSMRGALPDTWDRLGQMAARAESELMSRLGRGPSRDEIYAEAERYALAWAVDRVRESGSKVEGDELEALAQAKLTKNGMRAALEHFDEVRVAVSGALSLDAPCTDEGGTLLDILGEDAEPAEAMSVLSWFLGSLEARDRELLGQRFGLDGEEGCTFEELGQRTGEPWTEVRSRISGLLGRMTAPHAQFISLDPTLESRFEQGEPETASGRLAARRAAQRA